MNCCAPSSPRPLTKFLEKAARYYHTLMSNPATAATAAPPPKKARIADLSTSSLYGPPTLSLTGPGNCQFTEAFAPSKLVRKWDVSHTSSIFRFDVPDKSKSLQLSTCACVLAKATVKPDGVDEKEDEEEVIRPYTPISTNELIGCFDLLVKNYGKQGKLSRHMHSMEVGDTIEFKHIPFNVKIQAPFSFNKIGMIVGGTGITPMIQALHAILGDKENKIKVSMLYGSRESSDILGIDLLKQWQGDHFDVTHVLSHEPGDSSWKGERGFITKALIQEKLPSSKENNICIFVCGPPVMYEILCGPREDKEVKGLLHELGYTQEQVYKF